MNYRENFAPRLIECRKRIGASQKTIADIIGVSDAAITMLERGKRSPSFEVLCALADYFDVSVDYLVGRTDNPNSHKG